MNEALRHRFLLAPLAFAVAVSMICSPAEGSGTPRLAGATVVRAGHRTQLAVTLSGGDPSTCRLAASSGRKRVVLSDVRPRRVHVSFSWTVPAASRSASWRLLLTCNGRLRGQATLSVRGRPRGVLTLTRRAARVRQSGALLGLASSDPAPNLAGSEPAPASASSCTSPSSTGSEPSPYNTTPPGPGPWQVPVDPCNTEVSGGDTASFYGNCGYWAAEKRPDVWVNAVWIYGYSQPPGGGWNIELDAQKAGYPIDHNPQVGDLVVWPPNAAMGTGSEGETDTASYGGHVAYVESVNGDGTIVISEMGWASDPTGGYTKTLTYNPQESYFIHQQ